MNKVLFSSDKDNWTTPKLFFNELNNIYHFTIDLCADNSNHLLNRYYSKENTCLDKSFANEVAFMNPPYGRKMGIFIKKCFDEATLHNAKIVLLIPSRTDTLWFHNYIYNKPNVRIEFIKGRLKFGDSNCPAPFPSMLVYYNL